jgi:hypothetical protein
MSQTFKPEPMIRETLAMLRGESLRDFIFVVNNSKLLKISLLARSGGRGRGREPHRRAF